MSGKTTRPQKITLAEMRASGVRGLLIHRVDHDHECALDQRANFHFTTPHADTSRFMQNMSITEGSGCGTLAIQISQSSSDAKIGLLCIGWHWSALAPMTMHTATMKTGAVI
jgi:hypothetical protein